jgi:hypothetical protein
MRFLVLASAFTASTRAQQKTRRARAAAVRVRVNTCIIGATDAKHGAVDRNLFGQLPQSGAVKASSIRSLQQPPRFYGYIDLLNPHRCRITITDNVNVWKGRLCTDLVEPGPYLGRSARTCAVLAIAGSDASIRAMTAQLVPATDMNWSGP